MKKLIEYTASSTPTKPELGYGDTFKVFVDDVEQLAGSASTCCNPYKIDAVTGKHIPWDLCMAWIALGEYSFRYYYTKTHGRCLLVNGGGAVAARNPNVNHGGHKIATEVLVHKGGLLSANPMWRGSLACITHPPAEWDRFMDLFEAGDVGTIRIIDAVNGYSGDAPEKIVASVSLNKKTEVKPMADETPAAAAPAAPAKSILASKTLWLNLISIILVVVDKSLGLHIIPANLEGLVLVVVNVLNMVLRMLTNQPVVVSK